MWKCNTSRQQGASGKWMKGSVTHNWFFSALLSMSLVTGPTVYEVKWLNIYDNVIGIKIALIASRLIKEYTNSNACLYSIWCYNAQSLNKSLVKFWLLFQFQVWIFFIKFETTYENASIFYSISICLIGQLVLIIIGNQSVTINNLLTQQPS